MADNKNHATEKTFDEGFDNILIFDYDKDYKEGALINADSLVFCGGRKKASLNGEWNFCVDVFDSFIRGRFFDEITADKQGRPIPGDFSFDEWDAIPVPGQWNTERAEYALYEGAGIYIKNFAFPSESRSGRTFLRLGAANYEARIWLNKSYLGRHLGGFTPFMIDITELLQEDNRLLITVNNTRRGEYLPSLNYDWFNFGGIHRDVELLFLPEAYIKDFRLSLLPNGKFDTLELDVKIENALPNTSCKLIIPELGIDCSYPVVDGVLHCEIPAKPELWSPENPKLYEAVLSVGSDEVRDNIGFREIRTIGTSIKLNGKDVFLKGMCVHEESPTNGRSVSNADIENMLLEAKALGCNFLRLTHYPHSELTSKLADKIGIMLWEEIPVYWALEFSNPGTFADASNQLTELIIRDYNRASVIIWSVGNENPDSDERFAFMSKLAETARALDSSRPIAASCLIDTNLLKIRDRLTDCIDIIGVNEYYGWYLRDYSTLETILTNSEADKPVVITETGAEAVSGRYGATDELYTEECQAEIYRRQFEIIQKYSYIRGISPWILYDYASMRRLSKQQSGYNLKGLISKDRKHKKLAYDVVRKFYTQLP